MAVTHGHGNPNWNRDETILAMEVYLATKGHSPGPKDPDVVALSELLRSLPYHHKSARTPTFRNPDGAAFKVQNLRSIETGKGLQNVSRMDRLIWEEFGSRPQELTRLAALIKQGIEIAPDPARLEETIQAEEEVEFYEGRLLTRLHRYRERRPEVRRHLLKERGLGGLRCEVCGVDHANLDPALREAAFEAHHTIPIASAGEGPTRIRDMALLCATCHRLLHRAIAIRKGWLGIEDARAMFGQAFQQASKE